MEVRELLWLALLVAVVIAFGIAIVFAVAYAWARKTWREVVGE